MQLALTVALVDLCGSVTFPSLLQTFGALFELLTDVDATHDKLGDFKMNDFSYFKANDELMALWLLASILNNSVEVERVLAEG
ncbi:hypothetical protein CANARDRAFT_10511 [[Candida] arabinofermentans NRRL YB-2248]|uniref:Uncharacterized protein n=1 Tax=[Candida] arabinofermentans NRRL YB-2248 TaxID=983967 RepID=A0A1E4SSJ7_9ASCO|nr:hypothetical protein CANARDRAFT_10511 [[Candida] arabinofermentans NRRL YB-2248]